MINKYQCDLCGNYFIEEELVDKDDKLQFCFDCELQNSKRIRELIFDEVLE